MGEVTLMLQLKLWNGFHRLQAMDGQAVGQNQATRQVIISNSG